MVENQKLTTILFFIIWAAIAVIGVKGDRAKPLSKHQAYDLVYKMDVVQSFISIDDGRYEGCINSEVLRPCDTDWVTCIDDAWVVKFEMKQGCVKHDGRLSVTVLVDAQEKRVRSTFPEKEYFINEYYCLADYDCLSNEKKALNFVHGQIEGLNEEKSKCKNNQCELK